MASVTPYGYSLNNTVIFSAVQENRTDSTYDYTYTYAQDQHALLVFEHINSALDLYVKPVMYLFGIAGNLVSFAVFMCTFMRHSSSSIYLAALSISDTAFILCTLLAWSDNLGWRLSHKPGLCQLVVYVSYVAGFLSVWYVVGFTIERCLAIQFPLQRQVSPAGAQSIRQSSNTLAPPCDVSDCCTRIFSRCRPSLQSKTYFRHL